MIFEYLGFIIHQLAIGSYLVIGPGFRGYAKSESDARQIINIITAVHCEE
jgi:hypothetical protein